MWRPYCQRNLWNASCQHNHTVNDTGLCHEISGREVVSIAPRRWSFFRKLLIGFWKPSYSRSLKFTLTVHCFPTREKSNLSWILYLHTCAHTHFSSFTWTRNNPVLIRKDRLTLAKDRNGKKSPWECPTIPQFPLWLPPKAEVGLPWPLPFFYQVFALMFLVSFWQV